MIARLRRAARMLLDRLLLRALRFALDRSRTGPLDVFFAYRLLLDRPPDPEGWRHYRGQARAADYPPYWLAETILGSEECRRLQERGHGYDTIPVRETIVRVHGFDLVIDENDVLIGGSIRKAGTWEPAVTAALRAILRQGHVFVDAGANIGFFSLLASKLVGPAGRVIAIEPIPHNYRLLEKSIARNGVANIELLKLAVAAGDARITLVLQNRWNSGSFHLDESKRGSPRAIEVEARSLDDVLEGRHVDAIKIDVEGAEGIVLRGMAGTLARCRPVVLMEYGDTYLREVSGIPGADLLRAFEGLGYGFQEVESIHDGFVAREISQIEKLVGERRVGHLDLVLFPTRMAGRRPSEPIRR